MSKQGKYLSVEQPDQEVTIDFLSFYPVDGIKVDGCSIKLEVKYNERTEEASLYVYAVDAHQDAPILFDDLRPLTVTKLHKPRKPRNK